MPGLPDSGSEWSTFCSLYDGLVQWALIPKRWWRSETRCQHWSRCAGEMIWTWIDSVFASWWIVAYLFGVLLTPFENLSAENAATLRIRQVCFLAWFFHCCFGYLFFIWESSHLQPREVEIPHRCCTLGVLPSRLAERSRTQRRSNHFSPWIILGLHCIELLFLKDACCPM